LPVIFVAEMIKIIYILVAIDKFLRNE